MSALLRLLDWSVAPQAINVPKVNYPARAHHRLEVTRAQGQFVDFAFTHCCLSES
jgi:hypothetical protein